MRPIHSAVAVLLVLAGSFWFYSGQLRDRHQEAANRYLNTALTDIGSWRPTAIERHLAPEARAAIATEQIEALASRYRALGTFQRLEGLEFARISVLASLVNGRQLLNYGGTAHFSHGQAHLSATLAEHDGQLRLYNFNLSSPSVGQ